MEYKSTVGPGGQIAIPPGEQVRIVVMWEPSNLELAWRTAGRQRFEAACSPEDAVYEQLIDDPAIQ